MSGPEPAAEAVLSAEVVGVGTEWIVSGRLRVRKQIVTYTRSIEVTLRREELVVDFAEIGVISADGRTWAGTRRNGPPTSPPVARPPHVLVLHEEVPQVVLASRAYERVTASSVLVVEDVPVAAQVRHEQVTFESRHLDAAVVAPHHDVSRD